MNCEKKTGADGESSRNEGEGLDVNSAIGDCQPLDLFPEEIWLQIFKRLDNPRDLLHAGESCSFLQDLLERGSPDVPGAGKKVCELVEILPLALKWLGKADILSLRGVCKRVSLMVDQVLEENFQINPYETLNLFPWLVAPLPSGSLRQLTFENDKIKLPTKVCPAVIVDSPRKIFSLEYRLQENSLQRGGRKMKIVGKRICIDYGSTPAQIELLESLTGTNMSEIVVDAEVDCNVEDEEKENPPELPGGSENGEELQDSQIDIGLEDGEEQESDRDEVEDEESDDSDHEEEEENDDGYYEKERDRRIKRQRAFLEKCSNVLAKFPQQIQSLQVILGLASDSYTETYKFLRQMISSLPNLRRLEYVASSFIRHPDSVEEADNLKKYIDGYPLPPSPNLTSIITKYIFWPETFLCEVSERYGDQLKELSLIIKSEFSTFEERHYQFPVLQNLSLHVTERKPISFQVTAPLLKSLATKNIPAGFTDASPLITLILQYPMLEDLKVDLVNTYVPSPKNALEQLEVYDELGEDGNHKNLKRLIIFNGENSNISLRFFTRLCPNLESITVEDDTENDETNELDLKMMRARCMKKSTVWKEAVNLRKVKHVKLNWELERRHVYECTRP